MKKLIAKYKKKIKAIALELESGTLTKYHDAMQKGRIKIYQELVEDLQIVK